MIKQFLIILFTLLFSLACRALSPASVQNSNQVILDDMICQWDDYSFYLVFKSNFSQTRVWEVESELNNYFCNTEGLENLYILMEKSWPGDPYVNMDIYLGQDNYGPEEKVYHIECEVFKLNVIHKPLIVQDISLTKSGSLDGSNATVSLTNRQSGVSYQLFCNGVFVQEIPDWTDNISVTQPGVYTIQAIVYDQNVYSSPIVQGPITMLSSVNFSSADVEEIEDPELILSRTQNYITHFISHDGTSSKGSLTAQYYDGLGRPVQTVQFGITPTKKDLVTWQEYDAYGRESNAWLPVVASGNGGSFVPFSNFVAKAGEAYPNETKPYSKPVYESSPLNRVLEQYGPGQSWHNASRSVKSNYLSNIENVDTLNCKQYRVTYSSSSDTTLTITNSGNYATGQLYVTRISDEDGGTGFEFKDKLGQVVLTRQILRKGSTKELYDTYYIYDDYGNRAAVLPPLASEAMRNTSSWSSTMDLIDQYAYLYAYDHRNRCKSKKLPGCSWILYMYDKADRLIFIQDGNQRNKTPKEWSFTLPDVLGRVVLTGTCTNRPDASVINITVVSATYPESGSGPYLGYALSGVNLSGYTILSATYYDHYRFRSLPGFSNTELAYESSGIDSKYLTRYGVDTSIYEHKGLLTGTATALLDESVHPTYLYTAMYYDDRGRVIQTKSTNHLNGGVEKEYVAYNFVGQPLSRMHIHSAIGKATQTELYTYAYDHAGRPLTVCHQLNGGGEVTLADNEYDELGRLKKNKRNGQVGLTTSYAYNIRSWIQDLSNTHFVENLSYTFGGNIQTQQWQQAGKMRKYEFSYDLLSRLTSARYIGDGNYSTNYAYDKHGNITSLSRWGNTGTNTYGLIDELTMGYNGNQLIKVDDSGVVPELSFSADFRKDTVAVIEYFYDTNGNMKIDLNKGISNIDYNLLNLPSSLSISNSFGSATNSYVYSTGGSKLRVDKDTFHIDYVGNVVYEQGLFKRLLVEGGYVENGVYHFYITDHLGNNRVVANQGGTVVQSTQYYPFGMAFADGTNPNIQSYKYNNKEFDGDRGLNWYDYSARWKGDWFFPTMDPLAEKYYSISPYVYCANNPMRYVDPTGMYSTEEWKRDNDITDDDLIRVYNASDSENDEDPPGEELSSNVRPQIDNAAISTGLLMPKGINLLKGVSTTTAVSPLTILPVIPLILKGDTQQEDSDYSYVVYIKAHPSGKVYIGRTQGSGSPFEVLDRRDASHHMNSLGYGKATVHSSLVNVGTLPGYPAIRGREQQVIDYYGGIGSPQVGNRIRGVSYNNIFGYLYWQTSNTMFGPLMPYK